MKAIVQDRFGSPDVLQLVDVDPPEIGSDDVLVRVHAAAFKAADVRGASSPSRSSTSVIR